VCSFAIKKGGRGRAKRGFIIDRKVERDKRRSKLNIRKENDEIVWCNMEISKERLGMV